MAKNDIPSYDATAANNTDVQSVDISENCSPAGINNAIREVMADLKNVDTGAVALTSPSASQLNVDNLRLDGNTISSTDTNGDITLDPNGTGDIVLDANVGIGKSSSITDKLHIENTGANCLLSVSRTDGAAGRLVMQHTSAVGALQTTGSVPLTFGTADTERMRISPDGEITMPTQPAFLVTPSGTQNNIPINGLSQIHFGTEVYDQNGDFASNTFTAPVTGKYLLSIHLYTIQNDSATSHFGMRLTTSNRNYENIFDPDTSDADSAFSHAYSVIADMDAGDTASVSLNVDNSGSAQTDISVSSFFSGALIC